MLAWLGGFVAFIATLPAPALPGTRTDAAIVLTGGPGRVARGVQVLEDGLAKRLLISGVGDRVTRPVLTEKAGVPPRLLACCIDLGFVADDTRGNADEAEAWVIRHRWRSVRLITAAYHLPRANAELAAKLGPDVRVVPDGVPAGLPLLPLAREYSKFIVRWPMLQMGLR
ncbi:YdcF family protein [Sandaracinobacteroides saxicola]|uniref:YdcF family protein n=2 Tax=Sandaracinobacteroides saxicola TaxID=2759707 RepID=A0A7G5IMB8_9SPHN|nr:YdcF family protein [Sandaracinobacteroides saxicola]